MILMKTFEILLGITFFALFYRVLYIFFNVDETDYENYREIYFIRLIFRLLFAIVLAIVLSHFILKIW